MNNKFYISVMKKQKICFAISILIIAAGLIFMAVHGGLNVGIDFKGGSMMQIDFGEQIDVKAINQALDEYGIEQHEVKEAEGGTQAVIRTNELSTEERSEVFNFLKEKFNLAEDAYLSGENTSSLMGAEASRKALIAVAVAAVGMLIYITFRFEFYFGLASVIALLHDVLIVISIFAIFNIPININFIAAILAIVGYSINSTIVIFDRFRENLKRMNRTQTLEDVADLSINQTMVRSINTSFTTLIVMVFLFLLGGESIRFFAMALLVGIIAGTYSSVFLASPIYVGLKKLTKKRA